MIQKVVSTGKEIDLLTEKADALATAFRTRLYNLCKTAMPTDRKNGSGTVIDGQHVSYDDNVPFGMAFSVSEAINHLGGKSCLYIQFSMRDKPGLYIEISTHDTKEVNWKYKAEEQFDSFIFNPHQSLNNGRTIVDEGEVELNDYEFTDLITKLIKLSYGEHLYAENADRYE